MKKWFISAVALLFFCSCNDDNITQDLNDSVSVAPKTESISPNGGEVYAVVASSGKWELTGGADWVSPDVTTGESGDVVTFKVDPNKSDADKTCVFTFTVGKATDEFTVISKTGELSYVDLISPAAVHYTYVGDRMAVEVKSNVSYRSLKYSIDPEDQDWLVHVVTIETEEGAEFYFDVKENTTYEDREATLTIVGAENAEVEVVVDQSRKSLIETDFYYYIIDLAGGSVEINVTANVEYDVIMSDGADDWLTLTSTAGGKFVYTADRVDSDREAYITFRDKDEIFSAVAKIYQKENSIINVAADMEGNRAWPAWNDPAPVTNMSQFTMETLVYGRDWNNEVSTIMGIEDEFLIRVGSDLLRDQLEIAMNGMTLTGNNAPRLKKAVWQHIAVTFDAGDVVVYIDGEEVLTGTNGNQKSVNFGVPHNSETGDDVTRCFWVGYSREGGRDLKGMLSEARIWNKVLTKEEINATNHFYGVDPKSAGLVAYWKFDDGEGSKYTVKDYTSWGNDLTSEMGIDWKMVTAPVSE